MSVPDDLEQGSIALEDDEHVDRRGFLHWFGDLSVRSKFLIMMLMTSLLTLATVSAIGYINGRNALTTKIFDQLTALRASKRQQIEWYFANMRSQFEVIGRTRMIGRAAVEFKQNYESLDLSAIESKDVQALEKFYETNFLPKLRSNSRTTGYLEDHWPRSDRAIAAQAIFISGNNHPPGSKDRVADPDVFTAYGLTHSIYHRWFKEVSDKLGFHDIFLIDAKTGAVLYSVEKEVDFATDLKTGPYAQSNLGRLFRRVVKESHPGLVRMTDFQLYPPSYNAPAAFVATPVYIGRRLVGVLAGQISMDAINEFMTAKGQWKSQGLGDSGEIYLVGRDKLMRSISRFMIQDQNKFLEDLKSFNVSADVIEQIEHHGTTVLFQPVNSEAVRQAIAGHKGTQIVTDYRGVEVLSSYTPLQIADLNWALLAEMDKTEALAAQSDFQRSILFAACILGVLTTIGSLLLSNIFVRPIRALTDGIAKLRAGDTSVQIESGSRDEYGDLARSFNGMASEIRARDETIEGKTRAYELLLRRIFPDVVADRLRKGETQYAERYTQVSVIYIIVAGYEAHDDDHSANSAIKQLNEVVDMFDAEGEKFGMEKVKTIGEHYLATCGLTVPRLDHARRTIEFARAIAAQVKIINRDRGLNLSLRAGIDSGPVYAGLVGSGRFVFDVWGRTANAARRIVYDAELNRLRVTAETRAQVSRLDGFNGPLAVPTMTLGEVQAYECDLDVGWTAQTPAFASRPAHADPAPDTAAQNQSSSGKPRDKHRNGSRKRRSSGDSRAEK